MNRYDLRSNSICFHYVSIVISATYIWNCLFEQGLSLRFFGNLKKTSYRLNSNNEVSVQWVYEFKMDNCKSSLVHQGYFYYLFTYSNTITPMYTCKQWELIFSYMPFLSDFIMLKFCYFYTVTRRPSHYYDNSKSFTIAY